MSNRNKKERPLVPGESATAITQYSVLAAAVTKSPLPSAEELAKYEKILPGATKILFDNFIKQSEHRMELEKITIERDHKRADNGQKMAFILGLVALLGVRFLFFLEKRMKV